MRLLQLTALQKTERDLEYIFGFSSRSRHVRSGPGSAAWRDLEVRGPVPLHGSRPQRTLGA